MEVIPEKQAIPLYLLLPALLLLVVENLPLFSPRWLPLGDGLYRYEIFHWYYANFLFHGEIPLWMPYGDYGSPAFFHQWIAISPAGYLVGLLGKLWAVTDTRLLYNLVCILESTAFVLGVILLSCHLFHQRAARLFVTLGAVLSLTWWGQPFLNLNIHYGLPWVFYGLLRWRQDGSFTFLWLAGIVEILSLLGNFAYAAVIHFWIAAFFLLPSLLPGSGMAWPRWQHRGHWPWLVLLLVLATSFAWFALAGLDGLINLAPGRDGVDQRLSQDDFFAYARLSPATLLFNQLTGAISNWEQDNYVGLAPLLLFFYAVFRPGDARLLGFILVTLFLLGLSLGWFIPFTAYHLPGMDRFRHISYLLTTAKVMMLFVSGFALQHWMAVGQQPTASRSYRWVIMVLVVGVTGDILYAWPRLPRDPFTPDNNLWHWLMAGRVAIYLIALATILLVRSQPRRRGWILLAAFLVDVASYQADAWVHLPLNNPPYSPAFFQATPLPYLPQRGAWSGKVITTPMGRSPELVRLLSSRGDFAYHQTNVYTFGHHDPCYPQTRLLLISSPVVTMLESRGGTPRGQFPLLYPLGETVHAWQWQGRWHYFKRPLIPRGQEIAVGGYHLLPRDDPLFWQAMGCGSYKLRVMPRMLPAADEQQAVALLANLADPSQEVVIFPISGEEETASDHWELTIDSFSSNRLELHVALAGEKHRWLYYADSWHRHWRVTVDGVEVPVYRAQVGFKAIQLPAGNHRVIWQFHGGLVGLFANLLAMLSVVLVVVGGAVYLFRFFQMVPHTNITTKAIREAPAPSLHN